MKRSTANWTTAIAASALLAMPVGSWAQQASPTPSETSRPAGAQTDHKGSANEHLRLAEAALNDIPAASLTGTTKTRIAELKRHFATLNKSASPAPAAGKTSSAPGKANWSTDVAAADRILTELLGAGGTTGATGTSGMTAAKPASKTAPALDEAAKAKLMEVRTHLTAFAASMSGTSAAPSPSTPSADDPSSSASASVSAAPAASATASGSPSASASTTAPPSSPASTSAPSPSASASTTASASTAATPSEASASASAAPSTQGAQPAQSVDAENVKRHLTAARDTLSQITQLPAAAQLTGDSRTQVSQLISNFNELITTNTEWRASYAKLQANLNALVGQTAAAPSTGTPGAVGTSGTTAIDPAIRAKLEEFRAHLTEFEKAAGAPAASTTPAAPTPDSTASATAAASPSSPTTAPATASPSEPATSSTASPSTASTSATGTAPSTSSSASASATPMMQSPAAQSSAQGTAGPSTEAMRHIEAIEAILNGASSSTGATGTSGSTAAKGKSASSPTSLDRAEIEKIRTHLSDLRKALNK